MLSEFHVTIIIIIPSITHVITSVAIYSNNNKNNNKNNKNNNNKTTTMLSYHITLNNKYESSDE